MQNGWRLPGLLTLGVLHAWSMAWPWGGQALWWLQVFAMAGLFWVLTQDVHEQSPFEQAGRAVHSRFWRGFWRSWWFAVAWLAATFWWLYISMHVYGGMPGWLSVLAVLLLAGALALFYAVAGGVLLRWGWGMPTGRRALLFAVIWLLAELGRGEWFTGFPWGAAGYAHVDGPLAGLARIVGVYGIGFLAVLSSALLVEGLAGRINKPWRAGAALLLVWVWGGLQPQLQRWLDVDSGKTPPISVALLQGNIAQNEKFQPNGGVVTALQWYGEQLLASQADLVVTPETALPMLPEYLPEGYWAALQQRFASGRQAALLGLPAGDRDTGYANAVVGMAPGGVQLAGRGREAQLALPPASKREYSYAKHHLVPFGEFIPFGFQWFVDMMHMPLGNFQRGALDQPRMMWAGQRIQPNICYEDLFGEELAASFVDAATAPTVLVNVSNLGWFGDTVAIDQHRHISRMRALELARPMLRATNTGATAMIDADGTVLQELPRLTRGVLTGTVQGRSEITPYAWWAGRFGLWPLWALGLLGVLGLLLQGRAAANHQR